MNNKERYLKFIKDFTSIGLRDCSSKAELNSASFYTLRLSLENMQKITNEMRKQIKEIYSDCKDNNFTLDTKEKNVEFVKDIKNIKITDICNELRVHKTDIYCMKCSDSKYILVISEIKRQLDEVYRKYSN